LLFASSAKTRCKDRGGRAAKPVAGHIGMPPALRVPIERGATQLQQSSKPKSWVVSSAERHEAMHGGAGPSAGQATSEFAGVRSST